MATAIDRAASDDYSRWLAHTATAAGCSRPVRLHGVLHDVDPDTGEIIRTFDTDDAPDGVIYAACGDRRASVCPACAETYRADTYQLIRAGLAGGKGVPESVATHPCVFATLTAPSFGPVHTRVTGPAGQVHRCRPRRKRTMCPHGRSLSCPRRHRDGEACLGKPLCPDCYDYNAAVVWNAHAPELWRRTTIALRRQLDKHARQYGIRVKLSYAKVAEFQARGLVHFHAIIRLDGLDPNDPARVTPPPPPFDAQLLTAAIRAAVASTWFATVPHPARTRGWDIAWGSQLDIRTVRIAGTGEITDTAVASYLAKYATKSTEAVGTVAARITAGNLHAYANPFSHHGRLIRAAWRLGDHPHDDFAALRRWAHMLGFRGHFSTKSRRYSTTLRALRTARATWRRRQHRTAEHREETTLVVGTLTYAGTGWRTTGDEYLALSAAARAREHQRIARQEATALT
ncbi:MAG: hypothetical protein J2P27_04285 [Actinobacteria bacterium]|nr:hypothetical protein [Actinomycetota bacterium]